MAEKKNSILVGSPLISCNVVCAGLKEKGLPHDSVWIQIGHFVKNLDKDCCLSEEQRTTVKEAFDEYLSLVKDKEKNEVERLGLDFIAEVDKLKRSKSAKALKEEKEFAAELLNSISKNLSQLYSTINRTDTCGMIDGVKKDALQSIRAAKDRKAILKIVEKSFDDVTRQVDKNQEMMRMSLDSLMVLESNVIIDKLTGVFNRRFFDQELPRVVKAFLEKEGKVPFSLLILDIDKFKDINDTYGHFIGDKALQQVARIIQNNCRAGIDSPIRIGGDEFALFLIGTREENAIKKADTIRKEIAKKPMIFSLQDKGSTTLRKVSISIQVSIGVCELNLNWKDIPAEQLSEKISFCDSSDNNSLYRMTCMLAESADQALYEAKKAGRNQVKACR